MDAYPKTPEPRTKMEKTRLTKQDFIEMKQKYEESLHNSELNALINKYVEKSQKELLKMAENEIAKAEAEEEKETKAVTEELEAVTEDGEPTDTA